MAASCFSTLYRVEGCAAWLTAPRGARLRRFSTLYRVEGCAAATCCRGRAVWSVVSVPSIGSKAVQRKRSSAGRRWRPSFSTLYPVSYTHLDVYKRQTLYRVEGCAAADGRTSDAIAGWCFSTLYRVEGCAALTTTTANCSIKMVSVPSIGSKAVQRRYYQITNWTRYQFQYPLSGRRLCSAPMTPPSELAPIRFQYPLSGRRLCSDFAAFIQRLAARVSVPSIGSKAVQR